MYFVLFVVKSLLAAVRQQANLFFPARSGKKHVLLSNRIYLAWTKFVARRLPLRHPRAYAIRPYETDPNFAPLRSLRLSSGHALRLILRIRIGPVTTGPYFVIFVLLSVIICAACANCPGVEESRIRIFLPQRRKACPERSRRDAKFGRKD